MSGADQRQDDLFSIENILAKGRSALKGLTVLQFLSRSEFHSLTRFLGCRERIHATPATSYGNTGTFAERETERD